jgi:fructan beta-fructosidase
MFEGNPVIPNPGMRDFRDPKVFWHKETKTWVMILAGGTRVLIYTSRNLIDWELTSKFGESEGSHDGVWECPDLFPLAVDRDGDALQWVMIVSVGNGAPNGGSGTQYFVGDFDGKTFTNRCPPDKVLWLDYGRDNYAGVTFSDLPKSDGRRILIGWMSNWTYAENVPTAPWRGAMTIPRELILTTAYSNQARLASLPAVELINLRREHYGLPNQALSDTIELPVAEMIKVGAFEILIEADLGAVSHFGLILGNRWGDKTIIGVEAVTSRLWVDRRHSGAIDFDASFVNENGIDRAELSPLLEAKSIRLHLFVDRSSVEIFANGGTTVMTEQIFPRGEPTYLQLYAQDGAVHLRQCDVWRLGSVWRTYTGDASESKL